MANTRPVRAITPKPSAVPIVSDYMGLLRLAVDKDLDVERLRQLIELRASEEARQAELAFDEHFAHMQAEFEAVKRSKQGFGYKYAPIEVLQSAYGPIIAKHGFSYRWREEVMPNGAKRCYMRISGWGHSDENFFDVPPLDGTDRMNPIQVAGAMSTYGRRYTFIAGFGVIVEDEDDDGRPAPVSPPSPRPRQTDGLTQGHPSVEAARHKVIDHLHELVSAGIFTREDAKEIEAKVNRLSVLVPASAIAELAKTLASLPKAIKSDRSGLSKSAEKSFPADPSDEPISGEANQIELY